MWGWVRRTTWSKTQELGCTPLSPSSVAHEFQTLLIETVPQCLLNSPTVTETHPGEQK